MGNEVDETLLEMEKTTEELVVEVKDLVPDGDIGWNRAEAKALKEPEDDWKDDI